jgi:hypothetical protein
MSKSHTPTALDKIEQIHSKLSDYSFVWFPFLFLKPRPSESISILKTLVMAMCFGIYFSAYYFLVYKFIFASESLQSGAKLLNDILLTTSQWTLFFAIWFNIVTRPLWNLRAKKLSQHV